MKNILTLMLMSIFLLTFIAGNVSAFEFDNVKTYDPLQREVTLKNSFLGIPTSDIANVILLSNTYKCGGSIECSAVIKVNLKEDYINFFKKLEITALNKITPYSIKEQNILIKTGEKEVEVKDYKEVCENKQNPYNKEIEIIKICENKEVGVHLEKEDIYERYYGQELKAGEYIFKITGKKETNEKVEWIPTLAGLKITEWAEWGATELKNDLGNSITGGSNAIGAFKWSAFWFNASENYSLTNVTVYVAVDGGLSSVTNVGIYASNSSGGLGSLISNSTNTIDNFDVNLNYTWNFDLTTVNITKDSRYWLLFWASGSGSFIRTGETAGTPSVWYVSQSDLQHFYPNADINAVNIKIYGRTQINTEFTINTDLKSPIENYNSSSISVTFSANATATYGNITNMTLYLWNGVTRTNTTTGLIGLTNSSNWTMGGLSDALYTWNVLSCAINSTSSLCAFSTNRTLRIDTMAPTINITYPYNNLNYTTFLASNNLSLNFTALDSGVGLSSCWYNNGTANITLICGTNSSQNFTEGYSTIRYYSNDTLNNVANVSSTLFVNYLKPLVNYSLTSVELETTTIYFNITATSLTQANATLNYNNTLYSMYLSSSNSTNSAFYRTITLPEITADTIKQFSISYYVNGILYNTSLYNQTVYNIPNLTVGSCSPAAYTFNLMDEETLASLPGDYEYNFYYGLSNSSIVRSYGKVAGATSFSICVNTTISPSWTLGSGEIFYRNSTSYVDRRYYLFSGTTLTNVTTNITLHDLLSAHQTSFKLEVEDTSLNPYKDKYTTLVRWYPDLNQYRVVDMGKTDETGSTVIHVKTEDVDYRIGVYEQNGSLLKLADPIRMVCLVSPCTYTLKISPGDVDYTSFLGIQYTLTFNETSGIWLFTYSDPAQKTSTMNLTVWKDTGTSSFIVCSNSVTGYSGAISCNSSGFTGTLRAEVARSASPPVILVQKVVQIISSAFKSPFGLWLSMLLALPVIFILAMVSPVAAILGGVIALIPALYFGSVNIGIVGGLAVLGGIVAHFLKRVS